MKPWNLIDSSDIPAGGGELRLYQRGEEYSIMIVGGGELMNTRKHGSEDALAELGCQHLSGQSQPRVLIGGLGMGFTLAAALKQLEADAEVIIAELVPAVVSWNQQYLGEFASHPLDDARSTVRTGDVGAIIREEHNAYDAILLDVDNGPEGLTHQENNWLYTNEGLQAAFVALRPGGVLAVWSASPEHSFTRRLRHIGFTVKEQQVRAHGKSKGAKHTIWTARRVN